MLRLSLQRKAKYSENKLKTLKARNEYLLTLEATNASVFKYYIHDLPDIIDVSRRTARPQSRRGEGGSPMGDQQQPFLSTLVKLQLWNDRFPRVTFHPSSHSGALITGVKLQLPGCISAAVRKPLEGRESDGW